MLQRTGERYTNTPESDLFLDRAKPSYMGGMLEMANARLYRFWGSLTEALHTGKPQNEDKTGGDFFGTLYADPTRLEGFLEAMTGLSLGAARASPRSLRGGSTARSWTSAPRKAASRWRLPWRTNTSRVAGWIWL